MLVHHLQELFAQPIGGGLDEAPDHLHHPFDAELLLVGVLGLGQTVGIEHEKIAGIEVAGTLSLLVNTTTDDDQGLPSIAMDDVKQTINLK